MGKSGRDRRAASHSCPAEEGARGGVGGMVATYVVVRMYSRLLRAQEVSFIFSRDLIYILENSPP